MSDRIEAIHLQHAIASVNQNNTYQVDDLTCIRDTAGLWVIFVFAALMPAMTPGPSTGLNFIALPLALSRFQPRPGLAAYFRSGPFFPAAMTTFNTSMATRSSLSCREGSRQGS